MIRSNIEDIEIELFVHALKRRFGHDFSNYAPASLRRRIRLLVRQFKCEHISELASKVLHNPQMLPEVIAGLSVPVSEMFRDPPVFRTLREEVLPRLASYPEINIWQAGCAFGQEVYSLAILLKEAGLYERSHIYATDFNDVALARAQEGIFPARDAKLYSRNYQESGGARSLSDYYHARYEFIKMDESLKERITFANHNLVCDGVFCEAHLILCRNVLIYFNDQLQDHALKLFRDSLVRGGFLCIGNRENIQFSSSAADFTAVDKQLRIYRRTLR